MSVLDRGTRLIACVAALACLGITSIAAAQQRPLVTEDPETIGAGRVLVEFGVDYTKDQHFPVSGLTGDLWTVPNIGFSFGISSIAEIQIDGSPYQRLDIMRREEAPLSHRVTASGRYSEGVGNLVIGTKLRLMAENERRPSIGLRLATKLPNSSSESGLEPDVLNFYASLLAGKTTKSTRYVVNLGLGIFGDPTVGDRQSDLLIYGLSIAQAMGRGFELVAEGNGRLRLNGEEADPNGENRLVFRGGARYTFGPGRIDAAAILGGTSVDPNIGFTIGYTHVFNSFTVP
jgi:Putative MetA-pathway of phenol degradation